MQGWKAALVDIESNGVEPYLGSRAIGRGLSPYDGQQYYYLPLQDHLDIRPILDPLEQLPLIGHNIKSDLHHLNQLGWCGRQALFMDTIVMARLWYKEEHPHLGLKELAKQIFNFDYPNSKVIEGIKAGKADKIPLPELAEYCCTDLRLTKELYIWFKSRLPDYLLKLFARECYLTRDLFDMEARGIMVDSIYLEEATALLDSELGRLLAEIRQLSGLSDFNPSSPPQVRKLMEQLHVQPVAWAKNGPSWKREALLEVRGAHEIALCLAKHRALSYQRSGFIARAAKHLKAGTDILHGEFKNWGTVTGRLSGDLQQIPKGWLQLGAADGQGENVLIWESDSRATEKTFSLRRLIRPRPGYILIKTDYHQIEMFILGFYMKDATFNRWLNSGNVHAAAALDVFGDAELYYERGKTYNFATVYGQGDKARAKQLGCTLEQAQQYRQQYEHHMPGYRKFLRRVSHLLERDGIIKNIYDREYQLDPNLAYRGVNYLCQGSAGDFVKFRLPETRELRKQIGLEMLITTHDDFVAEIPEANLKLLPEWLEALKPSPFNRKLELGTEYSYDNLVQLHPLEGLIHAA